MVGARGVPAVEPVVEEDLSETVVFAEPEGVGVFVVAGLRALGGWGGPFAAAVEEVAEEDDGVGMEGSLEQGEGSAEVAVCVGVG